MWKALLIISSSILMLLWPFVVWLSIHYAGYDWLLLLVVAVFSLRFWVIRKQVGTFAQASRVMLVLGIMLLLGSIALKQAALMLYYPVAVNLIMLLVFGGSLVTGMPIIERLARLTEKDLPPQAVRYTRAVTQVWCGFFLLNGSIAYYTCVLADSHLWLLWNGIVSYVLMAMLMGGEWIFRQWYRARQTTL